MLTIWKKLVKIGYVILILTYLIGCASPFISPHHFRAMTFISLVFPWLVVAMLMAFVLSFFLFKKYAWYLLFFLLLGYKNILSCFAFNNPNAYQIEKNINTIRLLSWNVNDFLNNSISADGPYAPRRIILNYIRNSKADVLCLQDFKEFENKDSCLVFLSSMKYLVDTLQYRYQYFSKDFEYRNSCFQTNYGTIILSKFPIIDSGRTAYNWPHFPEHLMYATISVKGKSLRFYNTHLRSMHLHNQSAIDTTNPDFYFIQDDDTAVLYHGSKFSKINYFDSLHVAQAQLVKRELNKCTIPFVFCADLNSVPSSYVYHHISSSLTDPFLQHGFGWGGTYPEFSPTLRIDVVLHSPNLFTSQYYRSTLNASDHRPIITDIGFR